MAIAIVIGATGLVGTQLVELLLRDKRFEKVVVFARKDLGKTDPGLVVHTVDFDQPEKWSHLVEGDILFSAMGTTISKAKTKASQYRVDYLYQYQTAQSAIVNGVKTLVLVSSAGASEHSKIFYSRMKGELERDVRELGFSRLVIVQPSILDGERPEKRAAEQFSIQMMHLLKYIPGISKYRPIPAQTVAKAMINLGIRTSPAIETVTLEKIFEEAAD